MTLNEHSRAENVGRGGQSVAGHTFARGFLMLSVALQRRVGKVGGATLEKTAQA